MAMSREIVAGLLKELAEWMEFEGVAPLELLVCGGVAMALQDLSDRTTKDVDVLGQWNSTLLEVTCLKDFPEGVKSCLRRVAASHPELSGFGEKWVNLGPAHLAEQGLPDGYAGRLKSMRFGERLTLHLLGRIDLIPLKLYAASDRFSFRQEIHFDDLKLLKPTFDELDKALEWVRTLDDFEEKRPEIQSVLERLGYGDLAEYV
jgi:hypothetical protein